MATPTGSAARAVHFHAPDQADRSLANALRSLAIDAVERANSGHPGMPMGMADVATVLFEKFMVFDPAAPHWPDRDRFILSAGHGSMLLYALNHLLGYEDMTLEQLKKFRQLGSITAGHPEVHRDAGIETTTGPLGQGIANAAGFALAERIMNARFGDDLVDHRTYVIASDGDLMEGISHEACALAGHMKLGRLIVLYDDNGITIDGPTSLSYSDDVPGRFRAYGWDVQVIDGHDYAAIEQALNQAQHTNTPSLICCKTTIGYGAPTKAGTADSHGAPLGADEASGAKRALNWPHAPFEIPEDIRNRWHQIGMRHHDRRKAWEQRFQSHPQREAFTDALHGKVGREIAPLITRLKKEFADTPKPAATRKQSGIVLDALVPALPVLIGGSADLSGSNNTKPKSPGIISALSGYSGQYIHYGVREHGMAAMMNGMALHGGIIPYAGTFLTFADYCRPAIRLSALMKQRVIYVMTHDSIGLGEDGPTHQAVEHLASLRAIPNLLVMRPCDGIEVAECWQIALSETERPSLIVLSRQNLASLRHSNGGPDNLCERGGYIVRPSTLNESSPRVVVMASGSEVEIAAAAAQTLEAEGVSTQVSSLPCFELLRAQDVRYKKTVTGGSNTIKIGIEAAIRQGWDEWLGESGVFIGMESFGESAPADVLYKHFGITAEAIVSAVRAAISHSGS